MRPIFETSKIRTRLRHLQCDQGWNI